MKINTFSSCVDYHVKLNIAWQDTVVNTSLPCENCMTLIKSLSLSEP